MALLGLFIGRNIARPLVEMTSLMRRVTEGEIERTIPGAERQDEVGTLARALGVFQPKATGNITAKISAVRGSTDEAVSAIQSISRIVGEMTGIGAQVASALEQQTAATDEITRNVHQATGGTREASAGIGRVEDAALGTEEAAQEIELSAGALERQANRLQGSTRSLLESLRRG